MPNAPSETTFPVHSRRFSGVGEEDRGPAGKPEADRGIDAERSERDDEGRQAELGGEPPVDRAGERSAHHADQKGCAGGKTGRDGELGHDHLGENHRSTDGEIDPRGQHDDGLPDGEAAQHRKLLEHERDIFRAQEALVQAFEDGDRDEQHDHRRSRGMAVQPLQGRAALRTRAAGIARPLPRRAHRASPRAILVPAFMESWHCGLCPSA